MGSRQQTPAHVQSQPYLQSTASSVCQSSTSLASLSTVPQTARMPASSAPMPSPSANQPINYFTRSAQTPTSHPSQQRAAQQQQQVQTQFVGQRGDGGGVPETAPFLQDFNLVAEAAKRAQMACLSRDLGDIGL